MSHGGDWRVANVVTKPTAGTVDQSSSFSSPVGTPAREGDAPRADLATLSLEWLYGALFALSLIAINPWGNGRGDIWVQPKVDVVALLTLLNLGFLIFSKLGGSRLGASPTRRILKGAAALWGLFLISGLVTMLRSPAPASSLRAHPEMGDGYLYWLLVGAFVLTNALVLKANPRLFRIQLIGVVVGGFILACAMFPQVLDWRIDYTDTSGQVSSDSRMLMSSMWVTQMPIGFHTSRGHAGFVVAAAAVLALVGLLRGWLKPLYVWPGYFALTLAVWSTATRSIYVAFAAGLLWVLIRFFWQNAPRRLLLGAVLVPLLSFGAYQGATSVLNVETRSVPALLPSAGTDLNTYSSRRLELWQTALKALPMRPFFGWGFDGFGVSWPYVADWAKYPNYLGNGVPVEQILAPSNTGFRYLGTDGAEHQGGVYTNKAHNIFIDTALSIGLVGLTIYSALFLLFFVVSARGSGGGLEAAAVVYFVFGLAWFESAQYSHLAWWALSAGLGLALAQRVVPQKEDERIQERPRLGSAVATGD